MKSLDNLERHLIRLEHLLLLDVAGRERRWSARLWALLHRMEQALRWHEESSEGADELLENPDLIRLGRRFEELCREYEEFLTRVAALNQDAKSACRAFRRSSRKKPATARGWAGAVPSFEAIRMEVHQLLAAFRKHAAQETTLVLEGTTTDIGAGD